MVPSEDESKVVDITRLMATAQTKATRGQRGEADPEGLASGREWTPKDWSKFYERLEDILSRKADEAVRRLLKSKEAQANVDLASRPHPPHDSDMNERIARLEGDVAGGKRVELALLGFGGLMLAIFAIVVTVLVFQVQETRESLSARMDRLEAGQLRLEDQMRALPGELRGIAESITSAITATQSGQPPVIVIERPAESPPPEE